MGQPRKQRAKYEGPRHPWQRARLDEERIIRQSYGTKNKKEIWKMQALITKLHDMAKMAGSTRGETAEIERNKIIEKSRKLGLLKEGQGIDELLGLTLKDVMERRLQTIVFKKGLALTIKQARQMITHEHIIVDGKKITSPSYLVTAAEEQAINYSHDSPFAHPEHAEIVKQEEKKKKTKPQEAAEEEILKAKKKEKTKKKPKKAAVADDEVEEIAEIEEAPSEEAEAEEEQ
ncbi:30S ribosomal protein S4 [Candidatus Woesearchaeota archaeon]|nr:30S ribosomal protein S4 [Candidatus Woesearchaeota archaeon]MBW3016825.1 30S ribosomal protein S4 [Candidatus Woesearchaeota archaeon]